MHGEIFNAEMEPAFLNSTDVMEKVIVPTERMSTNVVSYMITKVFLKELSSRAIKFVSLRYWGSS